MAIETALQAPVRTSEPVAKPAGSPLNLPARPVHTPFPGCAADPVAAALSRIYEKPSPLPAAVASVVIDANVLAVANDLASQPTGEQRFFPRRTAAGFVSVVRYPPAAELTRQWTDWLMQTSGLTGELVDLSRSGLALVLLQPFAAGDALVVRLSQQDSDDTLDAVVEVVRSIDLGDQRWKIMAQFTRPLDFEEAYEFASHDQDALPPLFAAT